MKTFNEFINENSNGNSKQSYDDFLKEIEKNMITDFKMTKEQAVIFIKQYNNKCIEDLEIEMEEIKAIGSEFGVLYPLQLKKQNLQSLQ